MHVPSLRPPLLYRREQPLYLWVWAADIAVLDQAFTVRCPQLWHTTLDARDRAAKAAVGSRPT